MNLTRWNPLREKEDVKVSVSQGVLTIQGERKAEREETGKKYHIKID